MAKMMLHRDVLKNFGKLPAKVQKKVYELTYKVFTWSLLKPQKTRKCAVRALDSTTAPS